MAQGKQIDLLVFAAHPDDAELSCGGTIIKHARMGKNAGIIDLTKGELSTRGNVSLRSKEAGKASKILGLKLRENLEFKDGLFTIDEKHLKEVVGILRKHRPEIVLCNAISDRHPDHGRASELVSRACFLAGLIKYSPKGIINSPWRPRLVFHYIQDRYIKPDLLVDISPYMEDKMKAIQAFSSQFFKAGSNEPETKLTSPAFLEWVKARASELGGSIGVAYAEGFVAERTPAVETLLEVL